jgi:hypothetical protein
MIYFSGREARYIVHIKPTMGIKLKTQVRGIDLPFLFAINIENVPQIIPIIPSITMQQKGASQGIGQAIGHRIIHLLKILLLIKSLTIYLLSLPT